MRCLLEVVDFLFDDKDFEEVIIFVVLNIVDDIENFVGEVNKN